MEIKTGRIFNRVSKAIKDKHRIIFLRGGARSGKSFMVMQLVTIWLYTGWLLGRYVPEGGFTIVRATFPALRATVMRDFTAYLFELDIYKHVEHKKTIHEFHYDKRHVDFIPADSEQKLRGRKHTFAWLEEINDLPYEIFTQVNLRLSNLMFMTVNPSGEPWGKTEIEEIRMPNIGDVLLDVSTYKDNPFLEESIISEIEKLKYIDKELYQIYNLGIWTKLQGLIYPNITVVDYMPVGWNEYYGLDFGYVDPTCMVHVAIKDNDLYIDLLFHETGLMIEDVAEKIREVGGYPSVMCDSAEPRSIEHLRRLGINARAVKKGADSVWQRIMFIKQHHIFVTASSLPLIDEWKKFKWDVDINKNMIDKPINMYKHSSDATSYAISKAMRPRLKIIT